MLGPFMGIVYGWLAESGQQVGSRWAAGQPQRLAKGWPKAARRPCAGFFWRRRETPRNVAKRCETSQNAAKSCKFPRHPVPPCRFGPTVRLASLAEGPPSQKDSKIILTKMSPE